MCSSRGLVTALLLTFLSSRAATAQVALAPRISLLGVSQRYAASPPAAGLNSGVIDQAFQDVIYAKFRSDVGRAGLDETMYFRLRSGGIGSKSMLRLRRMSRSQAIGLYAEKRLVITTENAEKWRQVSKQNAPQNDLYKFENGHRVGAQVKTHRDGDPSTYVRDMHADDKAERFLIPDDHYDTTLQYLRQRAEQARAAGDSKNAAFCEEQIQRLGKIGAPYGQLEAESQLAARVAQARMISARVGWVITGVMVIPSVYRNWDAYHAGTITGNEVIYNLGKDAVAVSAGFGGAALGRAIFGPSPWGIGGTAAVCFLVVQEGFLIQQYGSFESAFSQPQFWVVTSGNMGGAALGLLGTVYGAELGGEVGSIWGPVGTGVGTVAGGVIVGGVAACAGSWGGTTATSIVLDLCAPDWVYARYDQEINERIRVLRGSFAP